MNRKKLISTIVVLFITIAIGFTAYQSNSAQGNIYLYGEMHAEPELVEREYDLWYQYYHEKGMRHLFLEDSYYGAEFLNIWMQSDSDELLEQLRKERIGSFGASSIYKEFYKKIKRECPETIFHGTDVGHQYDTTGERYLDYLEEKGQEESEKYKRAREVMKQGQEYYMDTDKDVYREKKMAENFIWEYEKLKGESVMGIYGGAHVELTQADYGTGLMDNMALQLREKYREKLVIEDLWDTPYESDIQAKEVIEINGKQLRASYVGNTITVIEGKYYSTVTIYKVKEGQEDFENMPMGEPISATDELKLDVNYGTVYALEFIGDGEYVGTRLFLTDTSAREDGSIMMREIQLDD